MLVRAALLLGCVCLLSLTGCKAARFLKIGGDDPEWIEATYEDVNRADLVRLVALVVSREYKIKREDQQAGEVESTWMYGLYSRQAHKQLRERVLAEVNRVAEGSAEVRLRVQREVNDEMGAWAQNEEGDWGPYDDDVTQAKILMKHLDVLLSDEKATEDAEEVTAKSEENQR